MVKVPAFWRWLRWTSSVAGATPPARIPGPLPPGLLLMQLDGLSRAELEASLGEGRMPFLASLLREHGYQLHSLFSGLPATTPSFQGEFFYGVRQSVPAWSFLEAETGEMAQCLDAHVIARREEMLKRRGSGLLVGGSAFACLLAGGADEVHFCTGEERWLNFYTRLPPLTRAALAVRYLSRLPRVALAMLREACRGLVQSLTCPSQFKDRLNFIPKRMAINVAVRRYLRAGIGADLVRGVPIIFGNFLDYDCHAHVAGPHSSFSRQVLPGVDKTLRHLWTHAQAAGRRRYQMWIFSDHGQQTSQPFSAAGERSLFHLVEPFLAGEKLTVADSGPVAHIYLKPRPSAQRLEQLARILVSQHGVPQILWRHGDETRVLNRHGRFLLPAEVRSVLGQHPFADACAEDLIHLSRHPEGGDLIALGWSPEGSLSFARELGCHAGPGPEETHAFALLPEDAPLDPEPVLRGVVLREAALRHLQSAPS